MGIKKFFSAPKPAPTPQYVPPPAPAPTTQQDPVQTEEERRKKSLVALNAEGGPQTLGDSTQATVTKRNLLGL